MSLRSLFTAACTLTLSALLAGGACAQPLSIGVLPAADAAVLYVAAEEGCFQDEGFEIELIPFKSALEVGAAMRAGRLDGHFGDLMNVLAQNETGAPQKVVLTTTHTSPAQRAFGLAVSPQKSAAIRALSDLHGTTSAMSAATIIDYLLDRMKETEGLPEDALEDQEIRQIPIRLQMLLSGKTDTAMLPEPLLTAVEQAGGSVIWDDRKLDEALAVVALSDTIADPAVVAAFRKAVAKAAAIIETDPESARSLMVKKRLLPKDAASGYQMVRFSLFGTKSGLPPLPSPADVARVGQWMLSHKMLKSIPEYSDVIFPE